MNPHAISLHGFLPFLVLAFIAAGCDSPASTTQPKSEPDKKPVEQLPMPREVSANSNNERKLVPVSGIVLIDGKPVTHGMIQFAPKGYRAATGKIGPSGRFTLATFNDNDGAAVGTHTVAVIAIEHLNPTSKRWHAPQKYGDHEKSGITVDITGPTNDLKIRLTWDGGKPFIEHAEKD